MKIGENKKLKTDWKYLLIVVILAFVVAGILIHRSQIFLKEKIEELKLSKKITELKEESSKKAISEEEIADWKTYSTKGYYFNRYGFEFKYPSNWYLKEFPEEILRASSDRQKTFILILGVTLNPEAKIIEGALEDEGVGEGNFGVEVFMAYAGYIIGRCEFLEDQGVELECIKYKTFSNFPPAELEYSAIEIKVREEGEIKKKYILIESNGIIYSVYGEIYPPLKEHQGFWNKFDLILSTFKYLE